MFLLLLILVTDLMALLPGITEVPQVRVKRVMVNINNRLIHLICPSLLLCINSHPGRAQVQDRGLRVIWSRHLQKIPRSIVKVRLKVMARAKEQRRGVKRET